MHSNTGAIRELSPTEIETVAGGNFLVETGKAVLSWAVGKVIEASSMKSDFEKAYKAVEQRLKG